MRLVRFKRADGVVHYGTLEEGAIRGLSGPLEGQDVRPEEIEILPSVDPPNILCIGLNYRKHADESGHAYPERPVVFSKPTTSLIGPDKNIVLPAAAPEHVDYEAELAIVIGKPMKNVSEAEALDCVLGYTCANDVSARDVQFNQDTQWTRSKSYDTFCPLGPCVQTQMDPDDAAIISRVNGQVMQSSRTSDMIFNCRQMLSFLSHQMTLLPGTVVLTGTPEGVGFARKPPVFLRPGDVVEIEIENIGILRNTVQPEIQE